MNWSKYNYLFHSSKFGYLLYNSLSNSFAELDEDGYAYLKTLEGKQNLQVQDNELYKSLIQMKVLVEDDRDEFYNIKYMAQSQRFADGFLSLTINPTLHCNFACPYCFEEDKPSIYMTNEVENALINFIKNAKHLNFVNVVWFGGEPLMAFDRIVSITQRIKQLGINYNASMVTNGYLLSDKVIDKLEELNILSIQITVDGLKETHDQRRKLISGGKTFEKIVANIDKLKTKLPNYRVAIRVNIDDTNAEQYIDVVKFFRERYKNSVLISPGFVTDRKGGASLDCMIDREKRAEFLIKQYKQYGINVSGFYPDSNRYECSARNPFCLVIGPEGEIYKCWTDVGDAKKVVGSLIDKKQVNSRLLTRYYTAGDPLDDENCKSCFHFPLCGGGCPYDRIENEFNGRNTDLCDTIKGNLQEFLELHYEFKQLAQEKKSINENHNNNENTKN